MFGTNRFPDGYITPAFVSLVNYVVDCNMKWLISVSIGTLYEKVMQGKGRADLTFLIQFVTLCGMTTDQSCQIYNGLQA